MRKFLLTLLILIIFGGAVFVLGWVQFSVPPGKYGVVSSKTHGLDPKLVQSGEFRWIWYKIIPTNVKISIFSLDQFKYPINFNSSLPSGNTYASFVGLANSDFTWNLQGEMSFSLDPDTLVAVAEQNNLTNQDELNTYMENLAKNIEVLILRLVSSSGNDSSRLEQVMSGDPDAQLGQEIIANFPEIKDFTLKIYSAKYPDFVLYREIRLIYEGFLKSQRDYITSSFGKRAESHIETQLRFDELERYGDMLTRYPILLDYLRMGQEIGD